MRLIDAEALKKAFYNRECWSIVIGSIIDDAPTVELTEAEVQETLNKRGMTAITNEYLIHLITLQGKRPKGEWIISQTMDCHSDIINVYTCPFCKERTYSAYPYCHCGADMRGAE